MSKHADDEEVLVSYASSRNVTMRSHQPEGLGLTWGEWRELSPEGRREAMQEYTYSLIEIWIEDDEDEVTW